MLDALTAPITELVHFLDTTRLPLGRSKMTLAALFEAGATIVITMVIAAWVGRMLETRLMRVERVDIGLRAILSRVVRAALLAIGVLTSAAFAGIDLTVLSVFGGALGVGLGLGLQRIASNYISGFVLLTERSLRIGDRITVDKYAGRVMRIDTRYTVLRGDDGTETIVPNEMLIQLPVINQSNTVAAPAGLVLSVPVDRGVDVARALSVVEAVARAHPRVLAEPPPQALVASVGVDTLAIELVVSVDDPVLSGPRVRSELLSAVLGAFAEHRIDPPPPASGQPAARSPAVGVRSDRAGNPQGNA